MLTIPVSFGNVLWYGVAKDDEGLYIGNYSCFDKTDLIQLEFFPTNDNLLEGLDPNLVQQLKWFAQDFYTVTENNGTLRFYNLQVDMTGTLKEEHQAPTSFYWKIISKQDGQFDLSVGVHPRDISLKSKWKRIFEEKGK